MRTVELGQTGTRVSALALGAMGMGTSTGEADSVDWSATIYDEDGNTYRKMVLRRYPDVRRYGALLLDEAADDVDGAADDPLGEGAGRDELGDVHPVAPPPTIDEATSEFEEPGLGRTRLGREILRK